MTREQAIKEIKEHCYFSGLVPTAKEALDMAIKALEQKKGKWIPPCVLDYESDAKCSLCHDSFIDAINYNYCPNCGAKMESEEV